MKRYNRSTLQRFYSEGHPGQYDIYINPDIQEEGEEREILLQNPGREDDSPNGNQDGNTKSFMEKGGISQLSLTEGNELESNSSSPVQSFVNRRHSSFGIDSHPSNSQRSDGKSESQSERKCSSTNFLNICNPKRLSTNDNRHFASPLSSRKVNKEIFSNPGEDDFKTPTSTLRAGKLMRRSASIALSKGRKLSGFLASSLPRK